MAGGEVDYDLTPTPTPKSFYLTPSLTHKSYASKRLFQ